ncbi:MAG: response regulator [Coleofasciculaceae cyanobacterium]
MAAKPVEILLIEDDPGDIMLIKQALRRSQLMLPLNVVNDGEDALAYLRREREFAKAVRPDLILLDLNLPGMNGREVLQEIKSDEQLKYIPIVVLTTSDSDEEILKSYKLGANAYVTKPLGLDGFATMIKSLDSFWFTIVKLPHT